MKYLSTVLITLLLVQTHFAQKPKNAELRKIRTELQIKTDKKELASVAVAVIRNGRTLWKETFGWADRERRIRADSRTVYPLASLSKSITATGLWVLAERGKLRVEDPVAEHLRTARLRFYQSDPGDLKIIHLLNMEGGIPHHFEYYFDRNKEPVLTLAEQIERYGFSAFPPGEVHNYSNFSMGLIEGVIADVSGGKFGDFMKKAVFAPLGMKRTYTRRPDVPVPARGYAPDGAEVPPNIFEPRGGAGMYSTLDDLIRYGRGHLGKKKFLKKETLEKAHRPNPKAPNPFYAGGWGVLPTDDGRTSLLSNGAIAGTATTLLLVPEEELIIVCLTNTTVGNDFTDNLAFKIAGIVLDGYAEALDRLFARATPLFAEKPFAADASYTGEWEGEIRTPEGEIPVRMVFMSAGEIRMAVADQAEQTVAEPFFETGLLKGSLNGTIPTKEALRRPHRILFSLMKKGDRLFGIASAQATAEIPDFLLPYYIGMKRKKQ